MTATPRIAAKGQRLYSEGRVTILGGDPYLVEGDHGEYVVLVGHAETMEGFCPCPARGPCSHLYAACLTHLQDKEARNASYL